MIAVMRDRFCSDVVQPRLYEAHGESGAEHELEILIEMFFDEG